MTVRKKSVVGWSITPIILSGVVRMRWRERVVPAMSPAMRTRGLMGMFCFFMVFIGSLNTLVIAVNRTRGLARFSSYAIHDGVCADRESNPGHKLGKLG